MFNEYVEAVSVIGNSRLDEHADEWGRFWATRGDKRDVLTALEEYDSGRPFLSGDCRLRFELTLQVRGKDAAYDTLVTAQGTRYGWNRYFTRSEDVRCIWAKLHATYPERWMEFLQKTLMMDPGHINRSGARSSGLHFPACGVSPLY